MKPSPVIVGGVAEPMAALDKVKIIENNEPLVDLRVACPLVTFAADAGTPEGMTPFLRQTAAQMLDQASRNLPEGLHLHAISALRSFERQKEIWWAHYHLHKINHPTWPESALRRASNKYAAPVDRPAPPGHCTGAAVDVVLRRTDGSFVDLIPECGKDTNGIKKEAASFDEELQADLTDWTLGATWCDRVSPEARKYRTILLEAMLGVGFSNCRDEYWHYSYGDSGWAVRVGEITCSYGVAELPQL